MFGRHLHWLDEIHPETYAGSGLGYSHSNGTFSIIIRQFLGFPEA
jgi:hypothetical protein